MTLKKLYLLCSNMTMDMRISIMEEGREPRVVVLKDVYYDISDRKIKWFSFESGLMVIKLAKKENK